jgi:6-phosphogluconolactonase
MTLQIETLPSPDQWADSIAERLTATLARALEDQDRALFAGAGGTTPSPIYHRMAQAELDWSRITLTLVDERYVPESSPDSNAAAMRRDLMTGTAAQADFIALYRPSVTVDRAASLAAQALARVAPRFDAVLLGMGEDGHICSMFPQSPTLKTLLTPTLAPSVLGVPQGRDGLAPSMERLSVNLAYLVQAQKVVLALKGSAKRAVFEREAQGDPATQPIAALLAANTALDVVWTEAV